MSTELAHENGGFADHNWRDLLQAGQCLLGNLVTYDHSDCGAAQHFL
jgi:hypothetical protein